MESAENKGMTMKNIIAKRLVLIIGTTMAVILLLNFLIQRDDALNYLKSNSALVIKQISAVLERNEQNIHGREDIDDLIAPIPVNEGITYYVVDKEDLMIVGTIGEKHVGKNIEELTGEWKIDKVMGVGSNYFYFLEDGDFYIGVSKPKSVVLEDVKVNMWQLFVYLFIAAYIMIFMSMRMLERYVIRGVDNIVNGVKAITGGKLETVIEVDHTPEFKTLSDNINQMTGSLLDTTVKISKILDTVDMLLAVYEYGNEGDMVFASGKIGAVLMLSEEETRTLLDNKYLFEERIDSIKQHPVEGYKKVYRLPVETDCFLQIETFRNQQSEFGVILDVTEEIIDKQRLLQERDSDLLTGLLTRRAFYQKMRELYQRPNVMKKAALMMCDLDGLKKFNDTYGHANGDKAIKKAAEILTCLADEDCYTARLSGDEFAVIFYGADDNKSLEDKIRKIYEYMLTAQINVYGKMIDVRLSGGYVFYSKYPEGFDQLLKKADDALYESKKNGRARFTEYHEK